MAINDKLLFKQALSAEMFSPSTGALFWTLDDLKDVNITFSADSEEKTDATNAVVAKYYQAKTAQVTGNTSFFTASLIAAQFGTDKVEATALNKIQAPIREKIKIGYSAGTYLILSNHNTSLVDYIDIRYLRTSSANRYLAQSYSCVYGC